MGVYESVERAKANGDVTELRIMMKNSLLVDLTFREFDEMVSLTKNVPGLYDEHDGALFAPREQWDDNYMNGLMVQVVSNFSKERLAHLKEVVRVRRPIESTNAGVRALPRNPGAAPSPSYGGARSPYSGGGIRSPKPAYGTPLGSQSLSYQQQKQLDRMRGRIRPMKIATSAVVGGVVGGVVAGSSSIILGVAVGVGIGVGISAIATKGGR